MAKKSKFYIPLSNQRGGVTFLNIEKVPELLEILPSIEDIKTNLIIQRDRKSRGLEYKPLQRRVTEEKFKELEIAIRKKKAKHQFIKKAFDIVGDINTSIILVQIVQV